MAPKRAKQPAAGKKAAADKPPAGGGGGSGGGALNGDNGAAPAHAAGSKRGRKELEDAEEYEATVPGRGSAAEEKGTGGAKRAAPAREPPAHGRADSPRDRSKGEPAARTGGKSAVQPGDGVAGRAKSSLAASSGGETQDPTGAASSSKANEDGDFGGDRTHQVALAVKNEDRMQADDPPVAMPKAAPPAASKRGGGGRGKGRGGKESARGNAGSPVADRNPAASLSEASLSMFPAVVTDSRPLSQQDLGLWGEADGAGYLELELLHAPSKVQLEDCIGPEFNHRKVAFWKSAEADSKPQAQVFVILDVLLAQVCAKKTDLERTLRLRLCTIRMWLRRGLYLRQYAVSTGSEAAASRGTARGACGASDAIDEVKAVALDAMNHESVAPAESKGTDSSAQRKVLQSLLLALDRLKFAAREGSLGREDGGVPGGAKGAAQQPADAQQSSEQDRFHTQVVGNQLIINNITSICNCEGMEQMLLSPLQGSTVINFGAHHRIVICPDAACAERANRMICETVRAYRNTTSKQAQQQSTKLAPLLSAAALGGGRVDLLHQLSSGGAGSPSKPAGARKAGASGETAAKAGARGGKGNKGGEGLDAEALAVDASTGNRGTDLPHRCITNLVIMTATGSLVPPDALVSPKAGPLLLLGTLSCEEEEAREDLARIEQEHEHEPVLTPDTPPEVLLARPYLLLPYGALQAFSRQDACVYTRLRPHAKIYLVLWGVVPAPCALRVAS
jgi:hypothetical protein